MSLLTVTATILFTAFVIVAACVWVSKPVWKLCKSVAYRVTGDEEDRRVAIPVFLGLMLVLFACSASWFHFGGVEQRPDGDALKIILMIVQGYAELSGLGMLVIAVIGLVLSGLSATFTGLNNAIRGE